MCRATLKRQDLPAIMPPHPYVTLPPGYVTLPWDFEVILEWLRREAGQEWVEEKVKQWRKRPVGAPSKYPQDGLDVIRVAHLAVTTGVSANKAIIELIGGKVELDRRRYDRLRERCAGDDGELLPELRWLGERIRPGTPPEGIATTIDPEGLDTLIDEILKQGPSRRLSQVWGEVPRTSPTSCC